MTNEAFRQFMQHSPWGNEFFHTPYQLACQLGLYCEAEDGYYYPRFYHDISEKEAQEYLEHWMPRYYVPNPYVGRNGFNDIKCPTYVLYELYKYATQHKNCTYKEAYEAVFQEKPTNNNDIVKNYINNYSKILRFEANGLLTITGINPNTVFDFMDRNNKKEFFENFSNNNGAKESLLVDQKNLTAFVLSTIQYFNKFDRLNALIPYSSITSPIKVSKEGVFSLTGMFLESNLEDVRTRNSVKIKRWFEDQFSLGERIVFLSTQWNANGDYQLTLDDFIKMIQCCYGTDYLYKTGPNGEHQLYLVSKKANNDLKGYPLQQIFYGAPGTGKSHRIKEIIKEHGFDEKEQVIRTTFHPDSDYSTFVGCYKPIMKSVPQTYVVEGNEKPVMADKDNQATKEEIVYDYTPQAFVQAYTKAWTTDKPVILVIEEINRGNCAQIFGDIFQLLDRGKDNVSEYEIKPDKALENYLREYFAAFEDVDEQIKSGKIMKLPSNLYIWATMNTSDQSLFPIDSAFKRRWEWKYMPINDHKDKDYKIEIGNTVYHWWGFLARINQVIGDTTSSEDKKLGYFFAKAKGKSIDAEQFVGKVLFYLWNDVFKNYGFDNPIFSKGDKKRFEFSDFFMDDGKPNVETVNQFLKTLEETIKMEDLPLEIKPNATDDGQGEQTDTL